MQALVWLAVICVFWLFGGFSHSLTTDNWYYKTCDEYFDKAGDCKGKISYNFLRWKTNDATNSVIYQMGSGPPISIKNCDIMDNKNWSCKGETTYYCFNGSCNFGINYLQDKQFMREIPGFWYRFANTREKLVYLF